jgi:sugar transferase (PEP-CTERM/EpsH1 system associated)
MNILFLAHRIPYPPDKGEKIRAYQELRFLAARHTVDLFSFADASEQAVGRLPLEALCRSVYLEELPRSRAMARAGLSLLGGQPFTTAYYSSKTMAKAVREAVARNHYDAVFVYCSAMVPYAEGCSPIPVCVDFVDSDASKWEQYSRYVGIPMSWVYAREARKLGHYEKEVARTARLCLVSTPLEIESIDPDGRFGVRAVENGVTLPSSEPSAVRAEIVSLGPYVVFVGQMDYFPNVDGACYFAEQILPLIRRKHPELQFVVVGRNPSRRVRRLAGLPGVTVTGAVPEVLPYLESAVAAVAPLRICQGVQNKILEALAIGLPVVATPRSARAVGASSAELLFVAETQADFARSVIRVRENPVLRRASGGREFVRRHFDWNQNLEPLDSWLRQAAGETSSAGHESRTSVSAT